jgi:hypothetical protein
MMATPIYFTLAQIIFPANSRLAISNAYANDHRARANIIIMKTLASRSLRRHSDMAIIIDTQPDRKAGII